MERLNGWCHNATLLRCAFPHSTPHPTKFTFRVDGFFPSSFQAFSSYSHDVIMSTFTPHSLFNLPDKALLVDEFVGRPLSSIRTPALVVDRSRFKANCVRVTKEAKRRGMRFRAHVKSTSLRGTGLMS